MSTEKKDVPTKVKGGEVRFCYAYVFTPRTDDNGEKKYSVSILIPKKNKALLATIEAGIETAKKQGIADKWGNKVPANLKLPLRDGDKDRPDNPEYKGMMFITASSKTPPGILNAEHNKIMDEQDFYSGCWGYFSVNFYPYKAKGNIGVGVGLQNLMKTKDDERLSGGASAEEDFKEFSKAIADVEEDELEF